MLTKLLLGAALALAATATAFSMPVAFRLSGDVVLSDSRAAVVGSTYTMTITFDNLARDYSAAPDQGLYGGADALISSFDFRGRTPGGEGFGAAGHGLQSPRSNSLIVVHDYPLGDFWYLNLFAAGLRLAPGDAYLPEFKFSVDLAGGTQGVTSKSLPVPPNAAAFDTALLGFFYPDNRPLLIGTVQSVELVSGVPEPASAGLMLAGMAAAFAWRRTGRRPQRPAASRMRAASAG